MGADLYIMKLRDGDNQYTGFRTDMNVGYYRDSYNNSNLLWQFDLSYWTDVSKKLLNEESEMSVKQVKEFLKLLKDNEGVFEKNLELLIESRNPYWDYKTNFKTNRKEYSPCEDMKKKDREKWVKAYKRQYRELKKFLNKAIKLNSPIECSL